MPYLMRYAMLMPIHELAGLLALRLETDERLGTAF